MTGTITRIRQNEIHRLMSNASIQFKGCTELSFAVIAAVV